MGAVWDFMSANQDRFASLSYTKDGVYQGLHCAIVGRSVGQMFSLESDYTTRFVNFNPRNAGDEPDSFESEALSLFQSDDSIKEYYAFAEYGGEEVFRYSAPMKIEQTCLYCHGEPAGEVDITGYKKEGWKIGDVGGAISIAVPLESYIENERNSIIHNVIFSVGILLGCIIIIYIALSRLVTRPLEKIQSGFGRIRSGEIGVNLAPTESTLEMRTLIHEFNNMAEELSAIYSNLEQQVKDRTGDLESANEVLKQQRKQLEEANRKLSKENEYKADFLAMVSHELRTPLTSIIAFAEMLLRKVQNGEDPDSAIAQEIEANSKSLLLMINDILEMSRLDAGKRDLSLEAVDVGDLVGFIYSSIVASARDKQISFTRYIEPDVPLIQADFEKLRHALENLVVNAIKFTETGGSVGVHVLYDEVSRTVRIAVSDSGIGIEEKDFDRIFERFVQGDSSVSRNYGGAGLGLTLVKEYVEMHRGTVTVSSTYGSGSTFTIELPIG